MAPLIAGIVMFVLGSYGIYFVSRREFYRRNIAGVEEFAGHGRMIATKFTETLIRIVSFILLVLGGLMALVAYIKL